MVAQFLITGSRNRVREDPINTDHEIQIVKAQKEASALVLRHDTATPRYTSYPPANFFTEEAASIADALLDASNRDEPRDISFYFHVPFCPRRCLFCGCHTEIDRSGAFIRAYLETLDQEFRLLVPRLDRGRIVTQVHFGGGTPNSVPYAHLRGLLELMRETFAMAPDAEIAMECDPSLTSVSQLGELRRTGFNRLSFGIQDLNPTVLAAVNRRPSRLPPAALMAACRELGFTGVNLDLICGLPHQTPESFRDTVGAIADAAPDRISLFPYAHVPWIKGHQAALETLPAPTFEQRLRMTQEARDILRAAGYESIGMDHFARPSDELAVAKREGTLRRNFQGYAPPRAGQVHALGASGISQLRAGYLQNEKNLERYMARVRAGELPFAGGYRMLPEDMAARDVINALLCQGRADIPALVAPYRAQGLSAAWESDYLLESLERLAPLLNDGLAEEHDGSVWVTPAGFPLSRRIAAAFDPRAAAPAAARYSRAL
jgi:oxygen-independent coproporphyrinogen-3 oxidase